MGIVVNLAATWMISKANRTSLNVQGPFQHILTDLFAFIGTAAAGLVMVLTGFTRADAIASLLVLALTAKAGIGLVRESSRIFLEAAPVALDPDAIGAGLVARPHVAEVHDLHVWEITAGQPALSAHVLVDPGQDCHAVRADLAGLLADQHHIEHTTLQVDHADPATGRTSASGDEHGEDRHGAVFRGTTADPPARESSALVCRPPQSVGPGRNGDIDDRVHRDGHHRSATRGGVGTHARPRRLVASVESGPRQPASARRRPATGGHSGADPGEDRRYARRGHRGHHSVRTRPSGDLAGASSPLSLARPAVDHQRGRHLAHRRPSSGRSHSHAKCCCEPNMP